MQSTRLTLFLVLLAASTAAVIGLRIQRARETPPSQTAGLPTASPATENEDASTTCPSSAPVPLVPPPQVSTLPPPTEADEEALLQLVEEAKRETSPAARHDRLVAICVRWAAFDPPAAIALALDSGLDPLEGALLPNLAQQWAAQDFRAAQAWAARLPAGELRDQVYSRLAYEKAAANPAAAARLLAMMRPSGPAREEATVSVVHAWAQRDPSGARAWVRTLASGPLHERALAELAVRSR